MAAVKTAFRSWNRKLDQIWKENDGTASVKTAVQNHRADVVFVLLMGCFLFFLAWILPFNKAPDEKMRYLIPQYIYRHGTLPAGYDPEIRNELWGISYGFHPILPYIFAGWLMRLVGLFNSSEHTLLMAARFINVLLGMGFYWYVLQISRKLFRRKLFRYYFVALLAMLPQLLYLFVYVNTDGTALFSSAMIVYYWLEGLQRKWDRGSCTGLAVGVSVCALSYFNAYGYALFSVILFIGSLGVFFGNRGAKNCFGIILKRGIYITVIVLVLTGWWFVRCAVLYDGDFLGLSAPAKYGELYAKEEFKPSNRDSVQEQGKSIDDMLRPESEGGMEWLRTTYRSTIGYFGYFEYPLGLDIYEIHKKLLLMGILGMILRAGNACLYYLLEFLRKRFPNLPLRFRHLKKRPGSEKGDPAADRIRGDRALPADQSSAVILQPDYQIGEAELHPANYLLLQFSLICCIMIPVILSLVYSYTDDFQPQGRYIMPMILPVMYFTAWGTEKVMTLFFRKWFVPLLMIPLFYAVLHVFLSAYVSVYIPAFCGQLSFLADIRFPWFSNIGGLVRILYLFIPG